MQQSNRRLTLDQVIETERHAWAGPDKDGRQFHFDGILFWRTSSSAEPLAAKIGEVPQLGWWHKADCNCPACQIA